MQVDGGLTYQMCPLLLEMRNSPTDYGTHWNIQDYPISQDKVRLVSNVE